MSALERRRDDPQDRHQLLHRNQSFGCLIPDFDFFLLNICICVFAPKFLALHFAAFQAAPGRLIQSVGSSRRSRTTIVMKCDPFFSSSRPAANLSKDHKLRRGSSLQRVALCLTSIGSSTLPCNSSKGRQLAFQTNPVLVVHESQVRQMMQQG